MTEPTKTLRDEFAMAALNALLTAPGQTRSLRELPGLAYEYADAMLKTRKERSHAE